MAHFRVIKKKLLGKMNPNTSGPFPGEWGTRSGWIPGYYNLLRPPLPSWLQPHHSIRRREPQFALLRSARSLLRTPLTQLDRPAGPISRTNHKFWTQPWNSITSERKEAHRRNGMEKTSFGHSCFGRESKTVFGQVVLTVFLTVFVMRNPCPELFVELSFDPSCSVAGSVLELCV